MVKTHLMQYTVHHTGAMTITGFITPDIVVVHIGADSDHCCAIDYVAGSAYYIDHHLVMMPRHNYSIVDVVSRYGDSVTLYVDDVIVTVNACDRPCCDTISQWVAGDRFVCLQMHGTHIACYGLIIVMHL